MCLSLVEGRTEGSVINLLAPVEYLLGYSEVYEDILSFILMFSSGVRFQKEKIGVIISRGE